MTPYLVFNVTVKNKLLEGIHLRAGSEQKYIKLGFAMYTVPQKSKKKR